MKLEKVSNSADEISRDIVIKTGVSIFSLGLCIANSIRKVSYAHLFFTIKNMLRERNYIKYDYRKCEKRIQFGRKKTNFVPTISLFGIRNLDYELWSYITESFRNNMLCSVLVYNVLGKIK